MPDVRVVWVDAGNDDDPAKLKPLGAVPAFDVREPRLTREYLSQRFQSYGAVYVYAAASWYPSLGGKGFATAASQRLSTIMDGPSAPDFPSVCLDIETDDIRGYLLPALTQWRKHRADRVTDLTIEGHKGGLFTAADVINTVAKVRYVLPQCYNGAMTQVWDSFAMAYDLWDAGFPVAKVRPFYDAAHLPEWWDGYAFTQGSLP